LFVFAIGFTAFIRSIDDSKLVDVEIAIVEIGAIESIDKQVVRE
jgi:hypothetical protein